MHLSTIRTIMVKELREILRDRRTLLLMIGVPVFLYPALFVLMEQVMLFGQGNLTEQSPRVAVHQAAGVDATLPQPDSGGVEIVQLQGASAELVRSGRFDAVLVIDSVGPAQARTLDVQLFYDASREQSVRAESLVREELEALSETILAARLESFGLPSEFARPIAVRDTSIATPRGLGGAALGRILPMILVLMTVLGAFHPAIDIAAGERERRTLEPLLTTSAPAGAIIIGKYLAVALIAFTAAALNLASMLLTLNAGIFQFANELGLEFDLPISAIAITLALLSLLALLFSALFLGIAVQAQSFREAQTMLTPVYLVSFLPAIVTMAPGIEFSEGLALIPIAGVALLFRALMTGDAVGLEGFIAVAVTIAYAALALSFAARSFAREDVLIGDDEDAEVGAEKRFPWWNRDGSPVPSPATAMLFAGLIGALFFYVGSSFARWGEWGVLASQWLLLLLPAALFLRSGRFKWREALAIRPAPPVAFLAGALIILGGLPIGWVIAWVQTFFIDLPEEMLAGLQVLLTADDAGRVAWLLFLVALTPALCEEIVFRGILLQGFLRRTSMHLAIFASSAVFGLFHLSFETVIRLLPTMFLGLLLAIVAARTASIFPSMLMHFVNNATAVLLISRPELQRYLLLENGSPNWAIVAFGLVLLLTGFRLLPGREALSEAATGGTEYSGQEAAAATR
jgi:sodium transport system permease protein